MLYNFKNDFVQLTKWTEIDKIFFNENNYLMTTRFHYEDTSSYLYHKFYK